MNRRILRHFGVEEKGFFRNRMFDTLSKDLQQSLNDNEMVVISGPVGAGKTTLFHDAMTQLQADPDHAPVFIYVRNFYKEHLTIAGVMTAIVLDITNGEEGVRRDMEARSRQVIRLIGKKYVAEKRHVVIVIEEAHRLHFNTIRALKEMREGEFAGVCPLFSVVLLGHDTLAQKIRECREAYLRSQITELTEGAGWMTYADRIRYLKAVYGDAIDEDARRRAAVIEITPLALDFLIESKMDKAHGAGLKRLSSDLFDMTPQETMMRLGISLKDVAQETGMSKTNVHTAIHTPNHRSLPDIKRALERIASEREHGSAGRMRDFKKAAAGDVE